MKKIKHDSKVIVQTLCAKDHAVMVWINVAALVALYLMIRY